MVSVNPIGKFFNTPVKFHANPTGDDKQNKESIKKFAKNQVNLGYGVIASGALAATSVFSKSKTIKALSVLPATLITISMGINMLHSGKAIEKEITDSTKEA